jgi:predicted transcriptional regulator
MGSLSISDTIKAISDDKSLTLFNTVALASGNTDILRKTLKLTRRQYYSRMSDLVDAGLVIRKNGKYFLTSFGRLVYEAQMIIGKAVGIFWKLKAIDSFETSFGSPDYRLKNIVELLIL